MNTARRVARLSLAALLALGLTAAAGQEKGSPRRGNVFTVNAANTGTELNGRPFQVIGVRVSNALLSDAETQELIDNMDRFAQYGVNSFSVFFQGSRFGDLKGYRADATLDPVYARRMGRIIEAADARGMVVLVGCLYHGDSRGKWESWGQAEAEKAIANTVRWLKEHNYRNVFVDVNNEHMAKFDDARLIAAGKAVDARYVIATSGRETPENADLSLHHGREDIPGKYYIESEGTTANYWGDYSKRPGLYNYINVGVYSDEMRKGVLDKATRLIKAGKGYMIASTWLQAVPPHGPHHTPGGMGTREDPGVRFWLEHIRSLVGGPYRPDGK